jgi:hypothetical protein
MATWTLSFGKWARVGIQVTDRVVASAISLPTAFVRGETGFARQRVNEISANRRETVRAVLWIEHSHTDQAGHILNLSIGCHDTVCEALRTKVPDHHS